MEIQWERCSRWYDLKSKPGKDKSKPRGKLEVRVSFLVKAGSLMDLSKKQQSSLGQLSRLAQSVGMWALDVCVTVTYLLSQDCLWVCVHWTCLSLLHNYCHGTCCGYVWSRHICHCTIIILVCSSYHLLVQLLFLYFIFTCQLLDIGFFQYFFKSLLLLLSLL